MGRKLFLVLGVVCAWLLAAAPLAVADDWFPHPPGAQWQYGWSDSTYNPSGSVDSVKVASEGDPNCGGWNLSWTGTRAVVLAPGSTATFQTPDDGTVCFQDQNVGLLNTSWGSSIPIGYPALCPTTTPANQCANTLAAALYNVIWGTRNPTLLEPLLQGTSGNATGGANGEVTSANVYLGRQRITVPAFPGGVTAAAVRSDIALAGTPGDDYGSGIRTTWWVHGVGPVKVTFDHADGSVTTVNLLSTNLKPTPPPPDADYFPLRKGLTGTYKWTNTKHLPQAEIEKVTVDAVANRTARLLVKSVSGPIRTVGQYGFSLRLDGLRNLWASTSTATLVKFPRLGHRRHFFTPLDLMTFGFNPILPAYGTPGAAWASGNARDFQIFGVTGHTRVLGVQTVHVPAGTFRALVVQSVLRQRGFRFGSGTRTCWFAPGRGLVKLVFRHGDGSTSVVTLLR